MTMVVAAAPARRRTRDSEAEIETEIYVRPPHAPQAWDRVMVLQIMQDLGAKTRAASARRAKPRVPAPGEPNVFLTWAASDPPPPWATTATTDVSAVLASDETLVRGGARRRTNMPWLLFFMAFGIAFGVGQDRPLRAELASKMRASAASVLGVVESSAMRLGRHVGRAP
jgi:hypothetical protein